MICLLPSSLTTQSACRRLTMHIVHMAIPGQPVILIANIYGTFRTAIHKYGITQGVPLSRRNLEPPCSSDIYTRSGA